MRGAPTYRGKISDFGFPGPATFWLSAPDFEAIRFPSRFPRGATFDIVCLKHYAKPKGPGSNNVKNGTSKERAFPPRWSAREGAGIEN